MNEQSVLTRSDEQSPEHRTIQAWLESLTAESTVGELPAFEATVRPDVQTKIVDKELGTSTDLPGVVIAADGELLGMISRPTLLAQLSRPFGQELYLNRPIRLLLEAEKHQPLLLTSNLLVGEAAHIALQRPADRVYEPVVVRDEDRFRLLDVHTLLIAQSRLLALANKTIQSQMEVADAANHAKSVFLAHMSHEIRTPLTAVLGFAENLLEHDMPVEERTAAVKTILRNGHHLLQLINDILDLSKIEAGRLEIERLKFSPHELVNDVIAALRVRAEARQIGLTLDYDGPIPTMIESDPTRLSQILMNLVGNAVKFTERGQVMVRLKMVDTDGQLCLTPRPDQTVRLQCEIIDSGIGMTEEQRSRLFRSFMQADQSMTRRFGGTGLGLSISRRLANLLGGDIYVTSQIGVGSKFTLQVDVGPVSGVPWLDRHAAVEKPSGTVARPADMRLSVRILLAEDGPDNQILIGSFLRKNGADVTIVDNGRKAVDAALQSLREPQAYDIILMDMQMPIMDGYSATTVLRNQGWDRPILALTANVMLGDRQKCLEAGCDDFATKPINRSELIEQIHRLTSRGKEPVQEVPSEPEHQKSSDDDSNLLNLDVALEQVGGDPDLLRQVGSMIIQFGPEWLDNMQRHLNDQDLASARRVAHSLKNSAENVGSRTVSSALFQLEEALSQGLLDKAQSTWPQCRDQFLRLLESLQRYLNSGESST